jgi:molybdopterin-binding protein
MGILQMNKLIATITDIQNEDSLNIVSFDYHDVRLVMMSLEISKDLSIGTQVVLSVNPSHIGIGKSFDANLSYSNIIEMKIEDIEIGKLLASIKLNHHDNTIESIITANSTKRMQLCKDDKVVAIIKASDLSILEVLYD